MQAAGGAALLALALAAIGPGWLRAGATVWVAAFPRSIGIQVLTGNVRVPAGQPLRLSAAVTGRGARLLSVVPSLVVSANGEQRTVAMTADGGTFSYAFESVDRSFQYRVVAGGAASDAFAVTALSPPKVQSIDVSYDLSVVHRPLAARGQGRRRRLRPGRNAGPSADSHRQAARREASSALARRPSRSALAADERFGLRRAGARKRRRVSRAAGGSRRPRVDRRRRVLHSRDGRSSAGRCASCGPHGDQGITPLEEVAIEARADDDYGIARFELVYAVGGRPAKIVPFTRLAGTDRRARRGAPARRRGSRRAAGRRHHLLRPGARRRRAAKRVDARRRATCSSSR